MKKALTTIIMAFVAVLAFAQGWQTQTIAGDELLGTKSCTAYIFSADEDANKTFIVFSDTNEDFNICLSTGVFDFNGIGANKGKLVKGLVGLYDENGKLIKKFDDYCFESVGSFYNKLHSNKYSKMGGNNKKNAKLIIEHLKNNKGFVRFVIPCFDDVPLDFKVNCMK